jgi:hypothetical protein
MKHTECKIDTPNEHIHDRLLSCLGTGTAIKSGGFNLEAPSRSRWTKRPLPQSHELFNKKGDVFDHFGSAFNNMKFRLFCPFLTIPLRTNKNF